MGAVSIPRGSCCLPIIRSGKESDRPAKDARWGDSAEDVRGVGRATDLRWAGGRGRWAYPTAMASPSGHECGAQTSRPCTVPTPRPTTRTLAPVRVPGAWLDPASSKKTARVSGPWGALRGWFVHCNLGATKCDSVRTAGSSGVLTARASARRGYPRPPESATLSSWLPARSPCGWRHRARWPARCPANWCCGYL